MAFDKGLDGTDRFLIGECIGEKIVLACGFVSGLGGSGGGLKGGISVDGMVPR